MSCDITDHVYYISCDVMLFHSLIPVLLTYQVCPCDVDMM